MNARFKAPTLPTDLVEDVPAVAFDGLLSAQHIPSFAEYLCTLVAPFDVLNYLHHFGHLMVSYLAAGHSHRQLYELLTKQQTRPVPVSYSEFSKGLATFRHQKGLPPTQVRKQRQLPAAAANVPLATPALPAAAAPRVVVSPSTATSTPTPRAAAVPSDPVAASLGSAAVSVASGGEVLSAKEIELREIEARMAKMFRPFTAEDAKCGKPIMEAVLDKQRADLAEYERGLKDGTITD